MTNTFNHFEITGELKNQSEEGEKAVIAALEAYTGAANIYHAPENGSFSAWGFADLPEDWKTGIVELLKQHFSHVIFDYMCPFGQSVRIEIDPEGIVRAVSMQEIEYFPGYEREFLLSLPKELREYIVEHINDPQD